MRSSSLNNKVIVITGASGGIGEAVARAFALQGAIVVLAARNREKLDAIASQLPNAFVLPTDLSTPEAAVNMVKAVIDKYGHIDILINNAACIIVSPAETVSSADLQRAFTVNMVSPAAASQEAMKHMKKTGQGHIINIGSPGFMMGIPFYAPYVCSKAAFSAWTRTIQAEWADSGIRISEYFPGYIKTATPPESRVGPVDQDLLMAEKQHFISRVFTRPRSPELVAKHLVKLARNPRVLAFSGSGVHFGTFISNLPSFRLSITKQMVKNVRQKLNGTIK